MKVIFLIKNAILNITAMIGLMPSFFGMRLEKKIANFLVFNDLTLSIAESCTGGLISSRMTDVSGSSDFIEQNFITYSNPSKEKYLGVSQIAIVENGVVSNEVASEMAEGLLKKTKCQISLATTGIAGPTGGSKKKPVGLIYISVANNKKTKTIRYYANSLLSRRIIKYIFSQVALKYLYKFLKENYEGAK